MTSDIINTVKATINAPISKVWDALTVSEIVKQYFFGTDQQSTFNVGDPITWDGEYQGHKYHDQGTILACEPLKSFTYSYWSSMSGKEDKPENYLTVTYELSDLGGSTEMTVTFSSYTEEGAKHSVGSWKYIIDAMRKIIE
jgi:uncharacterized protein YndB with AHSA1/START domain